MGEASVADMETERRRDLALLARASPERLAAAFGKLPAPPTWRFLRAPETGLVMLRARAGGDGAPFNLGEATVTRCVVALETGAAGYGQTLGRSTEKARLIALVDALLRTPEHEGLVRSGLVEPLAAALAEQDQTVAEETAATRVNFFTLSRGEDE